MNVAQKITTFFLLDWDIKKLYIEAYAYLAYGRIFKLFPFNKKSHLLGCYMKETSYESSKHLKEIKNISNAIHHMSAYTFWESQCLVKAIAGMKMLERRKIDSTLYLGTGKDEKGRLSAHAWLRSGQFYVSGAEEMSGFTIVGTFANITNGKGE